MAAASLLLVPLIGCGDPVVCSDVTAPCAAEVCYESSPYTGAMHWWLHDTERDVFYDCGDDPCFHALDRMSEGWCP